MFGGKLGYCIDPLYSTGVWHPDWYMSDRVVPGMQVSIRLLFLHALRYIYVYIHV